MMSTAVSPAAQTAPARVPSFLTALEPDLQRLEARLLEAVSLGLPFLEERMRALILAGGKRLRPSVTLYAGRMFHAASDRALAVAAGIELLHTATLVHDDLVDNASERRGVATLNSALPTGLVVLGGDLMFAEAARLVAEADHVKVVRSFARALSEICRGELLQARFRHTLVSVDDYYQRIYGKTASLFRTAAETGAMLGTDDAATIAAMGEYGRLLGMAFQVVDDALDFTSDAARLGKPGGQDLREGVISLPVLLYQARGNGRTHPALPRVIAGKASEEQIVATIEAVRASGAVDDALGVARDFARRAREIVAGLDDGTARRALIEMADFAVARDY